MAGSFRIKNWRKVMFFKSLKEKCIMKKMKVDKSC